MNNTDDVVFVFNGMGPQWYGMGQALYEKNTVFQSTVDEVDNHFQTLGAVSIRDTVLNHDSIDDMVPTQLAQPANLMMQIAIVDALKVEGRIAGAVIGHSIGEFTAAYSAGALPLRDACKVALCAGDVQETMAMTGTMVSTNLSSEDAHALLLTLDLDDLVVAAINGPKSVTFSGPEESCDVMSDYLLESKIFHAFLDVTVPFHHPTIGSVEKDFQQQLGEIKSQTPTMPFYSTVTGGRLSSPCNEDYWVRNILQPVRFHDAVSAALNDGYRTFLHIGAHPVMRVDMQAIFTEHNADDARQEATLTKEKPDELGYTA